MDEPPHDEPVYPPASDEKVSPRRRPLFIGLGVLLALAGALLAITNDDDGGGDGDTAIRDIDRAEDANGADGADPSSTVEPVESVEPAVDDTVMLVPNEALLQDWTVTDVYDGPLSEEVGEALVVVPSGSDGDLKAAVMIEVLPFDSIGDDRPVTIGAQTGRYEPADEDGLALLEVGDSERSLALHAASGTPVETLSDLASRIRFDTPIDDVDPGSEWEVLVTTAVLNEGHGYYVDLVSEDGTIEVQVAAWSGVDDSAMALFDLPFLAEPIDVRQTPGLSMSVWDDRLALVWLDGPGLTMWLSAVAETGSGVDLEGMVLELADQLVPVDAGEWTNLLEAFTAEVPPWFTTTTSDFYDPDPITGKLSDGREFTVDGNPDGYRCLFSDGRELRCDYWDDGEDLMRPSSLFEWIDGEPQGLVVFGPLDEGVEMVVVHWSDGSRATALTDKNSWAAVVPSGTEPVLVTYWTDAGSNSPRQVGSATPGSPRWVIERPTN